MKEAPHAFMKKNDLVITLTALDTYRRSHLGPRLFGRFSRYNQIARMVEQECHADAMQYDSFSAGLSEVLCARLYVVLKYCSRVENEPSLRAAYRRLQFTVY